MTNKVTDEGQDRDGRDFNDLFDLILEAERDGLGNGVITDDGSFRDSGTLGITTDIAGSEVSIIEFFTDVDIPDDLVEFFGQGEEGVNTASEGPRFFNRVRDKQVTGLGIQTQREDKVVTEAGFKSLMREEAAIVPVKGIRIGRGYRTSSATFGNEDMDMGVEVQLSTEGMKDGDNTWGKIGVISTPGEDRISSGLKEEMETGTISGKEPPEGIRRGEDDMMVGDIEEMLGSGINPVIRHNLTTGITEAGLTGMRDNDRMEAIGASVAMEAEFIRVTTG